MPPEHANPSPHPLLVEKSLATWIGGVALASAVVMTIDGAASAALAGMAVALLVFVHIRLSATTSPSWPTVVQLIPFVEAGLLLPIGHGCSGAILVTQAVAVQLTAGLTLGAHRAVVIIVIAALAAGGGRAFHDLQDAWISSLLLLLLGGAILRIIDVMRSMQMSQHVQRSADGAGDSLSTPLTGKTRIELEELRQDFTLVVSQLRQEKKSRCSAEEQVLKALRIKEAFLGTMSHELRTPLNQIIGYSEILLEDSDPEESTEIVGDVSKIHRAAMNLVEIVENVLDQSQLEAGVSSVQPEPVDIAELVDGLAHSYAAQACLRANTLRLRCPDDIGVICTDRTKLHTILKNLLSNACKFTENGTIRLAVEMDNASVVPEIVFSVSDTGIGISSEDMQRLFRPFLQVDGSTTRRFDGAGLGLAVSHQFCTMLNGRLTAASEPGAGSTFTVRLPVQWVDLRGAGALVKSIGV